MTNKDICVNKKTCTTQQNTLRYVKKYRRDVSISHVILFLKNFLEDQ